MSDLISRQVAISKYQKVCDGIKCGECPFLIKVNTEKGSHLITDCKLESFLYNLPSVESEPHWIPCSERLPEVNDIYLVCYEGVSVLMEWFNGHWFFYRTNPSVEETGTITAWMPLPKPYQSESEE